MLLFHGALSNLGSKYMDDGDLAAALKVLDKAFELAPDVPEVVCSRANTLHALNRSIEALSAYAQVVEQHPSQPQFRKGFADILAAVGGRELQAVEQYQRVIQEEGRGGQAATLSALAGVLKKLGRGQESIARYQEAVQASEGKDALTLMNLGVVEADEERFDAALGHLTSASELDPTHPLVLSNLGTVLHKTGQFSRSVAVYRQAWQPSPLDLGP